jgi:catechol 2,3-dioxygenase-like lactoylglutathione lyase family enzyme
MDNFDADRVLAILAQHGVTPAAAADPGLHGGPMKARVSKRGPDGTTELFFGDPDGVVLQVQDTAYGGGGGPLGGNFTVEPSPTKGLLALKEMSHFTISVSDGTRTNAFYKDLFGMPVRSMQATTPGWGVGPGVMFLMFIGGGGGRGARGGAAAAPAAPRASIHHVSINMQNFDPNAVMKTLAQFGITERAQAGGAVGPLKSYITLRMPDRGGAPGGTPELYFTDPDGLLLQLQDTSYCGGGGFLGNVCMG